MTCPCQYDVAVPGQGPEPSPVLFVGEAPGEWEEKKRIPFVGKTGKEVDRLYLPLAGLERGSIRITNAFKHRPPNNRKPTPAEIGRCSAAWFPAEMERAQPQWVVLMGGAACQLIGGLDLETYHGRPIYDIEFFGHTVNVFPTYHPAAGLHDTGMMTPLIEDFEMLGRVLEEEVGFPEDEHPSPEYRLIDTPGECRQLLQDGLCESVEVGVDTETQDGKPWSVQWATRSGTGYMVRAGNEGCMKVLADLLPQYPTCFLHNSPGDLDTLEALGIRIPDPAVVDTMQLAYHCRNLPQGLKPLAYRLCGMKMTSWAETVMPHSRRKVLDWIVEASTHVAPITVHYLTKVKRLPRTKTTPHPLEAILRRIYRHTEKPVPDDGTPYNPWKSWGKVEEDIRGLVGAAGPMPTPGIERVPLAEAVRYACRDADAELRVGRVLIERTKQVGREVVRQDWDVEDPALAA